MAGIPEDTEPNFVLAAKSRKKIPFWAMATLSLLPLWAFLYLLAIRPAEKIIEGPMAIGQQAFGSCAGCHGADGAGGSGQVLFEGQVLATFPKIEDMLNFVYSGSQQFVTAGLNVYGDPARAGGAHAPLSYNGNPMPAQGEKHGGAMSEVEILGVVCHERYEIGGADQHSEQWQAEFDLWCSADSPIFHGLDSGEVTFDNIADKFATLATPPTHVGTDPRPSGNS